MKTSFHPDGTASLTYCPRCERGSLETLLRFQCLPGSGIQLNPTLHNECATRSKRELKGKLSQTFKRYMGEVYGPIGSPLANVVKLTTGIDL